MLRPSKHSNPDQTVVHVATFVLRRVRDQRIESYAKLLASVKKSVTSGDVLLLPALNLLFLLGLVVYRPKNDSFEYTGDGV